jgi:hypothetical protein
MDKVSLHNAYDLARSRICRNHGIQGLGLAAERHDKASTWPARFSREHE